MADPDTDTIFELYHAIGESTGDMWAIAIGLTATEILIICHLLHEKAKGKSNKGLAYAIMAAGACNVISIASGALVKFSIISALKSLARGEAWAFDITTEVLNAIQMITLILGVFVFLWLFLVYSKVLAEIIMQLKGS